MSLISLPNKVFSDTKQGVFKNSIDSTATFCRTEYKDPNAEEQINQAVYNRNSKANVTEYDALCRDVSEVFQDERELRTERESVLGRIGQRGTSNMSGLESRTLGEPDNDFLNPNTIISSISRSFGRSCVMNQNDQNEPAVSSSGQNSTYEFETANQSLEGSILADEKTHIVGGISANDQSDFAPFSGTFAPNIPNSWIGGGTVDSDYYSGEEEDEEEGEEETGNHSQPKQQDFNSGTNSMKEAANKRGKPPLAGKACAPNAIDLAANKLATLMSEEDPTLEEVLHESGGETKAPPVRVMDYPGLNLQTTACFGDLARLPYPAKAVTRPRMYLKISGICSNAVKTAFKQAGFRRTRGSNWNALWGGAMKGSEYNGMNRFQKVNHFPGTWELGRKDKLYKNVARMRRSHGAAMDIVPRHYVLPRDQEEWKAEYERCPEQVYILKPCCSSRGRGIRVLRRPSDIPRDKETGAIKECLVQRYITDPHLINGYKYDLRIYVLVTCFDPLRVFVHQNGIVRFATQQYSSSESTLKQRCMHLTNYSINSKKAGFELNMEEEEDGVGSKWSLDALRAHFQENNLPFQPVWEQVNDIVVKTMISVESNVNTLSKMHVPHRNICFEIYGFDVVLDSSLQCWLLEVNTGPALQSPSPLDKRIKFAVVADMLQIVGFIPYDRHQFQADEERKKKDRLTGIPTRGGAANNTKDQKNKGPNAKPTIDELLSGRKDIKSIAQMDFTKLATHQLPEVLREMLGEERRSHGTGFVRAYPSSSPRMNDHYSQFFDCGRFFNTLQTEYLRQTCTSKTQLRLKPPPPAQAAVEVTSARNRLDATSNKNNSASTSSFTSSFGRPSSSGGNGGHNRSASLPSSITLGGSGGGAPVPGKPSSPARPPSPRKTRAPSPRGSPSKGPTSRSAGSAVSKLANAASVREREGPLSSVSKYAPTTGSSGDERGRPRGGAALPGARAPSAGRRAKDSDSNGRPPLADTRITRRASKLSTSQDKASIGAANPWSGVLLAKENPR